MPGGRPLDQLLPLLATLTLLLTCSAGQKVDPTVCSETNGAETLPQVPANLHVSMATVTSGQLGHMTIMANANTNRSSVTYAPSPSEEFKAIFDAVTNQILVINNKADQFDVENCAVQNATAASMSSLMTKVSFLGGDRYVPTGNFFNGAGLKINKEQSSVINGINVDRFRTCHFSPGLQMTLEVIWSFSQDTKLPVQIKSSLGVTPARLTIVTDYYPSPVRSMSDKQDATKHQFTAPRGVYCKGLISAKSAPSTYPRFSLGFDRYIYNLPKQPSAGPDSFRESYDQGINVTMIEGDSAVNSTLDRNKYGIGRLARINDFTRGISYIKNLRFENCSYEKIPTNDWDANPDPNGAKLKGPDDFYFPSLAELQYKGTGVYRSVDVDIYIGYKDKFLDIGDGKMYPLTTEYYLDIKVSYDGSGIPQFKSVPLASYASSTCKYNSLVEIYDFNTGVPRAYDHDVSSCFAATQLLHFELVMPIDALDQSYIRYLYDYRSEFTYALVNSLSMALNISPLRIINPSVSVFADPLFMMVEITVSEKVTVPDYKPSVPETDLSQIAATMTGLIAKGTLVVDVNEGDLLFQVPVKSYINLDARGSTSQSGMSVAAAAGLAVGMLLLGLAIGVGVFFALGYFRKDGSQFAFKAFDGPGAGRA